MGAGQTSGEVQSKGSTKSRGRRPGTEREHEDPESPYKRREVPRGPELGERVRAEASMPLAPVLGHAGERARGASIFSGGDNAKMRGRRGVIRDFLRRRYPLEEGFEH